MHELAKKALTLSTLAALGCTSPSPKSSSGAGGLGGVGAFAPAAQSSGGTTAPAPSGSGGGTSIVPGGGAGGSQPAQSAPHDAAVDAGVVRHDAATTADAAADAGRQTASCDRACLVHVFDGYLDALAARNPSALMVASSLKYTENGVTQQLGQGLWTSASKLEPDTRFTYADPATGQVGGQLVIDENGTSPVLYQARLEVVALQITEIESMAVRQAGAANGFFDVAGMKPEAIFNQAVDPSKRMTRDQLKAEVDHYIDYLDGKTDSSGVHLDANCARYENGVQTASGTAFALQNWSFDVVRRFLIFDEEYGIVWGMFPFTQDPTTLVVGEAFKVTDGKIMMIRAVMANMPANAWN